MITMATWNVNSVRSRLNHIRIWLEANNIDVLCLQETKVQDLDFPSHVFAELGYKTEFSGQKSYNGVCILHKIQASLFCNELKELGDDQKRIIAISHKKTLFVNVYIPNGSSLNSDKFLYKTRWLDAFCIWISQQRKNFENIFILGDFNIAPCDIDVHDPEEWRDKILCSEVERDYIRKLESFGFIDLFRVANRDLKAFSWWDYRAASFRRNKGLRIDLILAHTTQKINFNCWIDPLPRAWEKPSDHTPVLAKIES